MSSSSGRTSMLHRQTSGTGSLVKHDEDPEQDQQSSDLIVYARDTMEEILGWYGLQTTHAPTTTDDVTALVPSKLSATLTHAGSLGGVKVERDEGVGITSVIVNCVGKDSGTSSNSSGSLQHRERTNGDELPLDLTSANVVMTPDGDHKSSMSSTVAGVMSSGVRQQNKKLVGIRYLFPAFDERTTLLDRARVWVARHDYKYFVDWTEDQLESVDSALRPYAPITRDVYKLHMNRSEYCRNVKLKYCLVADEPWAQAFRIRLASSPSEGGFTGLCQAKIAAAELWRKYSENYRSHQARHMPPGGATSGRRLQRASNINEQPEESSRFQQNSGGNHRQGRRQLDYCNSPNFDDDDDAPSRPSGADKWDDERLETDETEMETDGKTSLIKPACPTENTGMRPTTEKNFGEPETLGLNERDTERDDRTSDVSDKVIDPSCRPSSVKVESATDEEDSSSRTAHDESSMSLKQFEKRDVTSKVAEAESGGSDVSDREQNNNVVGLKMSPLSDAEISGNTRRPSPSFCGINGDVDMEDLRKRPPIVDAVVAMSSALFDSRESLSISERDVTAKLAEVVLSTTRLDDAANGSGPTPSKLAKRSSSNNSSAAHHQQRQHLRKPTDMSPTSGGTSPTTAAAAAADYRRSERGLSFLFPSFADHHGMSLIDKVRVTVARHKNNYFLGWSEEQLSQLDPIVRPRVPVTAAVYREYCHRNAMKYDSNLQFACESPEPWAVEFRRRLAMSPADGGFTSLCEVKLEAGRLWREHSGRYRMHNIVKWQMGMNAAVGVVSASGTAGNHAQSSTADNATTQKNRASTANDSTRKSKHSRNRRTAFQPSTPSATPPDMTGSHLPRDILSEGSAALDLSVPGSLNCSTPDRWLPLVSPKLESPTSRYFRSCSSSASSASCSGGVVATANCPPAYDLTQAGSGILPTSTISSASSISGIEKTRLHRSPRGIQSCDSPSVSSVSPLDMTSKVTAIHRHQSYDDEQTETSPGGTVHDAVVNGTGNAFQPPFAFGGSAPSHAASTSAAASFPFFGARFDAHQYPGLVWPSLAASAVRPPTMLLNGGCFDATRLPAEFVHAAATVAAATAAGIYPHQMVTGPMTLTPAMAAAAAASWSTAASAAGHQAVVDLSDRGCHPPSQMLTDAFRRYVSGGEVALANMMQFGTRSLGQRGDDESLERRPIVEHRSASGDTNGSGREGTVMARGQLDVLSSDSNQTRRQRKRIENINDDQAEIRLDRKRRRLTMVGDIAGPTSKMTESGRRSSSGSLSSMTPTPQDLHRVADDLDDDATSGSDNSNRRSSTSSGTPRVERDVERDSSYEGDSRGNIAIDEHDHSDNEYDDEELPKYDSSIDLSSVVALLWSARDDLHLACKDVRDYSANVTDGETRETRRERPHFDRSLVDILKAAVGPHYAVPDDDIAAAVDLVLAFVQRRLVAADGEECRDRARRQRRVQLRRRRRRDGADKDQKTSEHTVSDTNYEPRIEVANDSLNVSV